MELLLNHGARTAARDAKNRRPLDVLLEARLDGPVGSDGQLDRHEFVLMCCQYLWRYPIAQIEAGANSFAELV